MVNGPNIAAIHQELGDTIRVNAAPLPVYDWIAACQQAGLTVQHHHTGPMSLLNPRRIAQEEGLSTLISMGWNILTRPILRQRILSMRAIFQRHSNDLGYIALCAQKSPD